MVNSRFPVPLPDDPHKWDGWTKYRSSNLYERLCLDPQENPSNERIEEHCRELLRWWQKKLPLKNQPTNPLTQLLRPGLDESARFLAEARVSLLDPVRRQRLDTELATEERDGAVAEFHKYLTFAIADGVLTVEGEKTLLRFAHDCGLEGAQVGEYIERELRESGARRAAAPAPVREPGRRAAAKALNPRDEFLRMLRLTNLDSDGMTDETRDAFINMAENMGLDPGEAEDMVDLYLDEADDSLTGNEVNEPAPATAIVAKAAAISVAPAVPAVPNAPAPFLNSIGGQMLVVPGGEFIMGSLAPDAAPNEQPTARITLSPFYMAKHPITNAEFEQFDRAHVHKRMPGAGDNHPVVHVCSMEAIKFCQWLSTRERKKYRLPTEAEWEFAARGKDGRKYPWGNFGGRGDLANFADKNTVFAWSDREISDGYPETSPVGAFPNGISPFGLLDMAGNVWEWCIDYFQTYNPSPRANPRGPSAGQKRIHRGGSWKSRFNSLRTTVRSSNAPNYSCNDLGFRVVCENE